MEHHTTSQKINGETEANQKQNIVNGKMFPPIPLQPMHRPTRSTACI